MGFKIQKIMDVGTSNPIVARMMGLPELIQMARMSEEKKEKIKNACFDMMRALIEAEKAAKPLIDEIKSAKQKIDSDGVKTQLPSGAIEMPSVLNLEAAKVFLKFARQALHSLARAMGVILDEDFNGPHFHKVLKRVESVLGPEHPVTKLLKDDIKWIKEIVDLRNEDEHPHVSNPFNFVQGFNITMRADGRYLVQMPQFYDGQPILECLEVFGHNLLTFSEEMIALSVETHFPQGVILTEIPEEQRDPNMPVRFRPSLKDNPFKK